MHISHMCSHSGQKARPLPLVADSVTESWSSLWELQIFILLNYSLPDLRHPAALITDYNSYDDYWLFRGRTFCLACSAVMGQQDSVLMGFYSLIWSVCETDRNREERRAERRVGWSWGCISTSPWGTIPKRYWNMSWVNTVLNKQSHPNTMPPWPFW